MASLGVKLWVRNSCYWCKGLLCCLCRIQTKLMKKPWHRLSEFPNHRRVAELISHVPFPLFPLLLEMDRLRMGRWWLHSALSQDRNCLAQYYSCSDGWWTEIASLCLTLSFRTCFRLSVTLIFCEFGWYKEVFTSQAIRTQALVLNGIRPASQPLQ